MNENYFRQFFARKFTRREKSELRYAGIFAAVLMTKGTAVIIIVRCGPICHTKCMWAIDLVGTDCLFLFEIGQLCFASACQQNMKVAKRTVVSTDCATLSAETNV